MMSTTAPLALTRNEARLVNDRPHTTRKENNLRKRATSEMDGIVLAHRPQSAVAEVLHRCHLEGCDQAFATKEALKKHKYFEHANCYCDKCDVDVDDWQQLLAHRARSGNHIACPFDGQEFKSPGALTAHKEQVGQLICSSSVSHPNNSAPSTSYGVRVSSVL